MKAELLLEALSEIPLGTEVFVESYGVKRGFSLNKDQHNIAMILSEEVITVSELFKFIENSEGSFSANRWERRSIDIIDDTNRREFQTVITYFKHRKSENELIIEYASFPIPDEVY